MGALWVCFIALALIALAPRASSADPAAPRGLLIIVPSRWVSLAHEYAVFKRAEIPTRVKTLESALASQKGVDDAEKLKRYLYREYRYAGIGYVLLVGDSGSMPVRFMVLDRKATPACNYAFYPSDLYYADLTRPDGSFDDWNGAKSGFHRRYFGEVRGEANKDGPINYDGIDYRPEIAVGRWPVRDAQELRAAMRKAISYEKAVASGASAVHRASFFVVDGWIDCRDNVRDMASRLPGQWSVSLRLYGGPDSAENAPTRDHLLEDTRGGSGLLAHAGHGLDGEWQGCFYEKDISLLQNAACPPVMISIGCNTGRFTVLPPYEPYVDIYGKRHRGTSAGESFTSPPPPPDVYQPPDLYPRGLGTELVVRGLCGASGYIGCNTGGQPCALTLLDGFISEVARPGARLGDCWASATRAYYDRERLAELKPTEDWYPPSIFFQAMKYMVYGDPSMPLPGP